MWDGSIVLQIFSLESRYCCPQYPTPAILHSFQREEKQPKRFHKSLDEVSNNNFENHWQIYLQRDQLINPEQIIICQVGQQIFLAMQVGFRWYLFALFFRPKRVHWLLGADADTDGHWWLPSDQSNPLYPAGCPQQSGEWQDKKANISENLWLSVGKNNHVEKSTAGVTLRLKAKFYSCCTTSADLFRTFHWPLYLWEDYSYWTKVDLGPIYGSRCLLGLGSKKIMQKACKSW